LRRRRHPLGRRRIERPAKATRSLQLVRQEGRDPPSIQAGAAITSASYRFPSRSAASEQTMVRLSVVAADDLGRQQRAQRRFNVANPSLAFCPIMIAAACGAPGQRQRLRQRDKSIDISLYSGWDELTSTPTRDHDLEHRKLSLCSPRSEAEQKNLRKG